MCGLPGHMQADASHVLRNALIDAVFFAPVFALILARWLPRYYRSKEIYALNAAIILLAFGAMVWYFPSRAEYAGSVATSFPVEAVEYLNAHTVPEPMYNSYEFGGYLLWARGPQHRVFTDGRVEIYEPAGVLSDQVALLNLEPGSLAILEKYRIQSCLLLPGEPLSTVLKALPDWQKVFEDSHSVLFVRRKIEVVQRPGASDQNRHLADGGI